MSSCETVNNGTQRTENSVSMLV